MSELTPQASKKVELFDQIYLTKQRLVFAFIFGRTGCRSTSEDLLQQVFLRLWQNIDELGIRSEDSQRAWLFTVARNLATDHLRKGGNATVPFDEGMKNAADPEEDLERSELLRRLGAIISRLEPEQREAFTLTVLGEQTSEQVAEIMSKPAGTVRYLVSLARQKIRQEIENESF